LYNNQEIEIGNSDSGSTGPGMMGTSPPPQATGENGAGSASIPLWAYVVRSVKLALDQQEFIYKMNDMYAVGVTITGQGAEAKVTDVVACSFEPFREEFNTKTRRYERKGPPSFNFYYAAKKKPFFAGTTKGVLIGSKLEDVLKAHKWPEFFFSFVTADLTKITITKNTAVPNVTVNDHGGSTSSGVGLAAPSTGGLPGDITSAAGVKPVMFTDGQDALINAGFAKSCLLLYPNDTVAFTLVDFTVVRIQIGTGVVRPPDPPKATSGMPGMR